MATTHIVIIKEKYYCAYIPSARSQKYAFDEVRGEIKVSVPSVTADEAPVAFRLSDYHHTSEQIDEIRWWGGRLWSKSTYRHTGGPELVVEHLKADDLRGELRPSLPYGHSRNRGLCVKKYREEAKRYLVIDGMLWEQTGEPRYVVNTFGLGHNHGGTGLFVEEFYNSNIPNKNYFSALDGDAAVAYANRVAERRGDTNDVGKFEKMIEVLIPEAVTIRPMQEHGEGDPFINKINAITEAAPDSTTAGLLAMMATAQEIEK
jgi:hypothetical protein